ncbi:MAG: hypothetical protein OK456_01020 [Thaumarchaeota archaeon]|nr:hypothetical protein [Nitrososphaerota archaeon]
MSSAYTGIPPKKKRFLSGGLERMPAGSQLLSVEAKKDYDLVPFIVYHPNPHDAVTILRNKKNQHDWLVCGWYVDTLRENGVVKGLIYRQVTSEADKEFVMAEVKKHDKEGSARFSV